MDQEKLVGALKSLDRGAIGELVETHGDRLLRSAFLLCGNETEAQDLVQDAFVEAIRAIHRFRGDSGLYTWLHSILLNLTRHYHRDRGRIIYDSELAARAAPVYEEQPTQLDADAASSALSHALRQLSDSHREVLVLRYYEHLKIQEMAERLGISKGTVKSRLHYAIREMEKLLPAEMNLFGSGVTKDIEKR